MANQLKEEIVVYIEDWHWDAKSKKKAFDLGKFLFAFIDYIDDMNITERTKNVHYGNTYCIGSLDSSYGNENKFDIEDLKYGKAR